MSVKLIMCSIRSSQLSILWNGTTFENFAQTRVLRQGDPMSSYLSVLYMEKLVLSVTEKVLAGEWPPIHLTRGGPCIYHLMFMDDVLLFCKAKNS